MRTSAACCCRCSASAPATSTDELDTHPGAGDGTHPAGPATAPAPKEDHNVTAGEADAAGNHDSHAGSDFVVVANRLPVDLERLPDGTTRWKRSPGGLVTALEPILRANNGAWVGWAGVADAESGVIVEDGLTLHSVRLSTEDIADYY